MGRPVRAHPPAARLRLHLRLAQHGRDVPRREPVCQPPEATGARQVHAAPSSGLRPRPTGTRCPVLWSTAGPDRYTLPQGRIKTVRAPGQDNTFRGDVSGQPNFSFMEHSR